MNEPSAPLGFVAPEPSELAPLFPSYEIHDLIATGGMGAVYRAVQKSLDRTVAIKILPMEFSEDAEFCAGFEAEAKAMARLNHPNLISVYDFGSVNGMLFIVMEFVPGKSLYHSAYGKAIDPLEVIRLVTGVCNGLAHAHENGILHRDIKPSNILLTPQKEPKIGDFGLARPMERKSQADEIVYGTPGYTAPEVVEDPDSVNHRADLFAVGVLLHELLTGKLPTDDDRPASVISGCDPRFDTIIRRATEPQPEKRFSSAAEITSELQQITAAPKTSPKTLLAGGPQAGAARPSPPRRTGPVREKRQSMNFKWVSPLIAICIMAFCWHQFMNMKPKVVVVDPPPAKPTVTKSSQTKPEMVNETTQPETGLSSTPPLQTPSEPPVPNTDDIAQTKVDESIISEDLQAAFQGKTETLNTNIAPSENITPPENIEPDENPDASASAEEAAKPLSEMLSEAKLFNGKKYLVMKDKCSWKIALERCQKLGGQLAIIPDAATQEFIRELANRETLWLGATDEGFEGRWRWIDGTQMRYKNFGKKMPDNWEKNEHWLAMNWKTLDGEWNDTPNDRFHGYICEWNKDFSIASNKVEAPKESDLPNLDPTDMNAWKNKALEDFPAIKDSSSALAKEMKVLRERKETVAPSFFKNPQWPYLLAKEANLALEKEAQAAKERYNSRFPAGAKSFNGKKYYVYLDNISWNRARVRCSDAQGQLAVIPDQETQNFITELADGRSLWIGATDQRKEGQWVWVDGTKMEFQAFDSSQPNNAGDEGQHYLACRAGGEWYDTDDKDEGIRGYICEWQEEPTSEAKK